MLISILATRTKDKVETIYILEQHEIPSQRLKLISEKTISNNEFRKKHGQLLYLENLKKSDFSKRGGGENPEPCPICQKCLGMQWSVLQCGHCFCIECMRILIEGNSKFQNKFLSYLYEELFLACLGGLSVFFYIKPKFLWQE